MNVEVYGGAILNTWLDRPLGVAGRVAVRSGDVFTPKVVTFQSEKSYDHPESCDPHEP